MFNEWRFFFPRIFMDLSHKKYIHLFLTQTKILQYIFTVPHFFIHTHANGNLVKGTLLYSFYSHHHPVPGVYIEWRRSRELLFLGKYGDGYVWQITYNLTEVTKSTVELVEL